MDIQRQSGETSGETAVGTFKLSRPQNYTLRRMIIVQFVGDSICLKKKSIRSEIFAISRDQILRKVLLIPETSRGSG